jgi:PAS domain S-box-containing protein
MTAEKKNLNILLVEDSEDDAVLIERKLRKEGFQCRIQRIENGKEMETALRSDEWDLIISDYLLPRFSGKEALRLAQKVKGEIPVVMVSGKVGEEKAVDLLKEGASDFVIKEDLSRLPFVVGRALEDARQQKDKMKTEAELQKVAGRYHMLAENISDIIWTMDTGKRFTFVSPSALLVTGYSIEEILDMGLEGLLVPEYYQKALDAIDSVLASLENKKFQEPDKDTFEAKLIRKDGAVLWTETKVSLLFGPRKKLIGFLGVTRDVSERKQNEQILKDTSQNLQRIMDFTPDAILTLDTEGKITFINRGFSGTKKEEFIGAYFFDRVKNPSPERMKEIIQQVGTTGKSTALNVEAKNSRWWHARLFPITGEYGIDQILIISSDITETREDEQQRLNLTGAVEQMEDGIVITDAERRIMYANSAFEKNSGFGSAEITGKSIEVLWEADKNLKTKSRSAFRKEKSWKGKLTRSRKDGSQYEAEVSVMPLRDEEGTLRSYIIVDRDITEDVELEMQFRRMQKMEALGTLAGGIAHDFNNILMPVIINTELLLWETSKQNPSHQYLEQTLEAAYRGKDLVKQILIYSRTSDVEKRTLDMVQTVKEILRFLGASLPSTIEIQEHSSVGSYLVNADPVQIQQVLMNIFKNAADAIGSDNGRIIIGLGEKEILPADMNRYPGLEPGPFLVISVSDTGCGMDKETAYRIFDPFFTTKNPGEGTGMGLAVAHKIVKNHQGDIRFSSEKGKGSVFEIYLPRADSPKRRKKTIDDSLPRGRENILLVDDEKEVVLSLKRLVEKLGYKVTEMTEPGEAMRMMEKRERDFDLVITDQIMPGMSGTELAEKLHKTGSDVPVILISGFAESLNPEEAKRMGIKELMMKPINPKELAQAIRRVLDAGV